MNNLKASLKDLLNASSSLRKKSTAIFTLLCLIIVTQATSRVSFATAASNEPLRLSTGLGSVPYTDELGNADKPIAIWYYKPEKYTKDSPIVFVMHGVKRDAERYCKEWMPFADEHNFLIVCPLFDDKQYPTEAYQLGNMFDDTKKPIDESKWTYTAVEHIFDYIKSAAENSNKGYYIFGHSAGGQFVHRFVLFMPNARYVRAIAANPGWYTMPNYTGHKFPYGLANSNLTEKSLQKSFGRDFILMLGEADIDPNAPELRRTGPAEEQGTNRFERGQAFFKAAQTEAQQLQTNIHWQLKTVPGAHHSDSQMAKAAAPALFAP